MIALRVVAVSAILILMTVAPVAASTMIDGQLTPSGAASVSYAGGVNPLVGSGIAVTAFFGIPNPPGPSTPSSAILSFTTGAATGMWTWGSGGSVSIMGNVPAAGASGTLLSGMITAAIVAEIPGGLFKVVITAFVDTVNSNLASFFGLTGGPLAAWDGNLNLSFLALGNPGDPFTSLTVFSGDVVTSPVPEPSTLLLLGTGVAAGVAGWRRWRRPAARPS